MKVWASMNTVHIGATDICINLSLTVTCATIWIIQIRLLK